MNLDEYYKELAWEKLGLADSEDYFLRRANRPGRDYRRRIVSNKHVPGIGC